VSGTEDFREVFWNVARIEFSNVVLILSDTNRLPECAIRYTNATRSPCDQAACSGARRVATSTAGEDPASSQVVVGQEAFPRLAEGVEACNAFARN
jgi:hypothetical protein